MSSDCSLFQYHAIVDVTIKPRFQNDIVTVLFWVRVISSIWLQNDKI